MTSPGELAIACLLLLTGCASGRLPQVGEPPPMLADAEAERAYLELLERYTDRRAIYDGLDTRMFAAATLQAPAFVEARVRRRGSFRAQPQSEVEAELAAERAALQGVQAVFLGVHLNDPKYDDLDRRDSIWRLALLSGGAELAPQSIRRVGRADLAMRAIYPYLGDFWVGYEVRFPATLPAGEKLVLKIASALGKAELQLQAR